MQGAPCPHRQTPVAEQLSARVESQATHEAPPAPQVATELWLQVVPSQHPGHEVESHTQRPPAHLCPLAHALFPPQVHMPSALQPSAAWAPHAMQARPPAPHVAGEGVLQVIPVQQPFGHAQLLHAPPAQVSLAGQVAQAWPALPHAVGEVPVSHCAPLQQPLEHDVASHVHVPDTQCWPAAHAAPVPH